MGKVFKRCGRCKKGVLHYLERGNTYHNPDTNKVRVFLICTVCNRSKVHIMTTKEYLDLIMAHVKQEAK